MAATAVTLNDLEGHSSVADLFKCNLSNICAAFYVISTDSVLCSHGSSALVELLVSSVFTLCDKYMCSLLILAANSEDSLHGEIIK